MGQNDLKIIARRFLSVAILMLALFLMEGVGILFQRRSDPWLYERAMEEAEAYYVQGRWYEAYRAYREALSHHEGDERALEGLLLSTLEAKKAEGDPMGAVELLEEGMKIFPAAETVEEMCEKREDILAHTQVKGETWYSGAGGKRPFEKTNYWEYDGDGRVVLSLNYRTDGGRDYWSRMEYDENGNMIREVSDNGNRIFEVYYNDKNLPVRKEWYHISGGMRIYDDVEYHSYDETGRRTRMSGKCSVIEYDRLENPVKEYKRLDWESVEDKIPDKVRIYKYHYTGG